MRPASTKGTGCLCALTTVLLVSLVSANGWVDEVTALPGWSGPLPTKMYSGYVNLTGNDVLPSSLTNATSMFMHYFLFEAESDPTTSPTIIWWNGGPGASSAWGLFVENGPLLLNEESVVDQPNASSVPSLILNPYRWTKFANLIAFCNPPPVGFSYCEPEGPTGNGTACGTWNDTRVGIVDAEAIRVVLSVHFPQLLANPVFFMGESYAGVYIGETLQWMLSRQDASYAPILRQLRGVALGDACLGGDVLCGGATGPYGTLMFFYGHGQLSTELWNWLMTQCNTSELHQRTQSAGCSAAITKMYDAIGGFYAYNLVDQCTSDAFQDRPSGILRSKYRQRRRKAARPAVDDSVVKPPQSLETNNSIITVPLDNGYWCPGQIFFQYFDRVDVRRATHVPLNSTFFNADDGVGMNYVYNCLTVMPTLTSLLRNRDPAINGGNPVQVWAYDGDTDPSVNVFTTQQAWWNYTQGQSFPKTKEWSAWTISDNIVGGYSVEWINGTLKYVTIRGSGHMVAEYKPAAALAMLRSFLQGTSLPPYVVSSPKP